MGFNIKNNFGPNIDVHDGGKVILKQHDDGRWSADDVEEAVVIEEAQAVSEQKKDELPTREQMIAAVEKTVRQGLWWSKRSWGVVFRVYQMKGYKGGYSHFIGKVESWKVETGFACNYDAVQKVMVEGKLIGTPDKWESQGASKRAVKLACALLHELERG